MQAEKGYANPNGDGEDNASVTQSAVSFEALCQQPASGRSSRVGVTQISWSPIFHRRKSADRHFNRDMAW